MSKSFDMSLSLISASIPFTSMLALDDFLRHVKETGLQDSKHQLFMGVNTLSPKVSQTDLFKRVYPLCFYNKSYFVILQVKSFLFANFFYLISPLSVPTTTS